MATFHPQRASAALIPHPATPSTAVHEIRVDVERVSASGLVLRYLARGNLARLRLPPLVASERADGLWQHTCFEAFVVTSAHPGYVELNFSPSTHWAAYTFSGYREGMAPLDVATAPRVDVEHGHDEMRLAAAVEAEAFAAGALRLALSAVIEDTEGGKSYWALAHPQGKPDFHHADGFALILG